MKSFKYYIVLHFVRGNFLNFLKVFEVKELSVPGISYFLWPMHDAASPPFGSNCFDEMKFLHLQGKYVEIQFSRGGQPEGGRISNFLLEKVGPAIVLYIRF